MTHHILGPLLRHANRVLAIPFCLVVLLFAAQAYAQSASPTFPNPGKTSMSKENQHALGMEVAAQVYQQMPVLPDNSPESQYVRQLGQKLVATIPQQYSWPFEFHVIPQKEINAFALPGGQMFINLGTITTAKNEAELAGVMGHEMAHVYMQHSAKQTGKAQTTSMLAGLASMALGVSGVGGTAGGMVGQLGQMGIQMGGQGPTMKYSRNDESQADAVGAVILYQAGYNPQSMADLFQTMGSQGGSAPPEFFSSHPNSANRQQAIQKQIAHWPAENYVADSPNFDKIRQHARQLKVYSAAEIEQGAKSGQWAALNQRNGASLHSSGASTFPTGRSAAVSSPKTVSLQSVLPSHKMVNADLGPIKIHHPENWKVDLPGQQGQFVTVAPQSAITNSGVGYGVLLNGAAAPRGQRMSIDEITTQLIQQIYSFCSDILPVLFAWFSPRFAHVIPITEPGANPSYTVSSTFRGCPMVTAADLKEGMAIRVEGQIYRVLEAESKAGTAKLGGVVKTKLSRVASSHLWEPHFRPQERIEEVELERRNLEFLFASGDTCTFMSPETFEQIEVAKTVVGPAAKFLKEGMRVPVEFFSGEPLNVILPESAEIRVAKTLPPAHAQQETAWKEATLENGMTIQVPMFVGPDEVVRVDVRTGHYLERVRAERKRGA